MTSGRARPATSLDTTFFWDGALRGELLAQACLECGRLRHPPGPACPACLSFDWAPKRLSGRGRIHSWTVHHHPHQPAFHEPPVIAVVDLEEDLRLVANVIAPDGGSVVIGAEGDVVFTEQAEGWSAPQFRLRAAGKI